MTSKSSLLYMFLIFLPVIIMRLYGLSLCVGVEVYELTSLHPLCLGASREISMMLITMADTLVFTRHAQTIVIGRTI